MLPLLQVCRPLLMLQTALSEVGTIDRDRGRITPRVLEYLSSVGVQPLADRAPYWGGAFLAWCAIKTGAVPPIGAAEPTAWEQWSSALSDPQPGCVVVLADSQRPLIKHVGIAVRRNAGRLYVVGGDHGGAVNIQRCEESRVIAARKPPSLVAVPQPSAQMVDVRVTVDRNEAPNVVYSAPEIEYAPQSVGPDQIEALRASVVAAIAAAAEARPSDERAIGALAELAAVATAASTRDGIVSARDRALAYMAQT